LLLLRAYINTVY